MPDDQIRPVLIVGGGPTGTMLAGELARRQVPCRVIDRKDGPTTTSRAFTIHARTLEIFETIGLAERFISEGLKSYGFVFRFEGLEKQPVLDFRILRSRYPYILVFSQAETERLIREHTDEKHGISVEWGVEMSALEVSADGAIRAEIRNRATDVRETIEPSFVVGADGVHSFVRKTMNLPFDGGAYEGMIMQMMDAEVDGYDCDPRWIQYFMKDKNFLLTTPLANGRHRILISDMGEVARHPGSRIEAYQSVVEEHGLHFRIVEPEWATQWVIWKRLANVYRSGNVFLCGDSAHVHSPSGGQGLNSCVQDAWNLGWKLAMMLRGEARPELLDSYETERKPIARQVIEGTDAMHDIIMAHGRGMEERMALTESADWQVATTELIAGVSYTYRDFIETPPGLASMPDGPAAGDRAPDADLPDGRTVYELFRHTGLTLLLMPADAGETRHAEAIKARVADRFGAIVHSHRLGGEGELTALAPAYGSDGAGRLYLVRPDGYIAFRSRLSEADKLFAHLDCLLVQSCERKPALAAAE